MPQDAQRQQSVESLPKNSDDAKLKMSEATALVSRLLSVFPERDSDDATMVDRHRGYLVAIADFPASVVIEAERRLLRGQVSEVDPRFMPTPPQLARLCGAICAEQAAALKPVDLRLERFEAPPDPAVVAKLSAALKTFEREVDRQRHETKAEWVHRMEREGKIFHAQPHP